MICLVEIARSRGRPLLGRGREPNVYRTVLLEVHVERSSSLGIASQKYELFTASRYTVYAWLAVPFLSADLGV